MYTNLKHVAFCVLFLTAASAAFVQTASAQERHTLKSEYPEGKYIMQQETSMIMTQELGGQRIPTTQSQRLTYEIVAGPRDANGNQVIQMTATRIQVHHQMMQPTPQGMMPMDIRFDSNDEQDMIPVLGRAFRAMLGMTFSIHFDRAGDIDRVEGLDEAWERLAGNMPPGTQPMMAGMRERMNADTFARSFEQVRQILPTAPVAVGDTWKTETKVMLPMVGEMTVESQNTFKAVERVNDVDVAVIESIAKSVSTEPQDIEQGPATVRLNQFSTETKTTTRIELRSGLLLGSDAEIRLMADCEIIPPAGTPLPPNMPALTMRLQGDGTTKMTLERMN